MIAAALLLAGIAALVVALVLLRRVGAAWRVGRLLAVAPVLPLAEVAAAARSGEERLVRIHGRIASDEEFPDENDKPLVYRRQRLEWSDARGRRHPLDDERLAVPFGLEDRQDFVALDLAALGAGLVVVPRVAEGTAAEIPEHMRERIPAARLPADPAARVHLRVEQVSAVEHATAIGVPRIGPDGEPQLTAGLGRPLILTPLDPPAAMRVLAADRRGTVRAIVVLLAASGALVGAALVAAVIGA
ncbi:MAG: hypothetical protein ACKOTZ_07880 [Chloroflexota bacterium]